MLLLYSAVILVLWYIMSRKVDERTLPVGTEGRLGLEAYRSPPSRDEIKDVHP
jgi:hypothetical protein